MKIRLITTLGVVAVFAMTGIASATLLINGDFSQDDGVDPVTALGWTETHSGGWDNRETSPNWPDPEEFHFAMGNAGGYGATIHQDVVVADDSSWYKLSADAVLDAWWLNSGYLKLEFYDAGATTLLGEHEGDHFSQPDYDVGLPLANYVTYFQAPAGTEVVRAVLGSYGEGGTARFDNAVLDAVPEPATFGLLGLAGAALLFIRRLHI